MRCEYSGSQTPDPLGAFRRIKVKSQVLRPHGTSTANEYRSVYIKSQVTSQVVDLRDVTGLQLYSKLANGKTASVVVIIIETIVRGRGKLFKLSSADAVLLCCCALDFYILRISKSLKRSSGSLQPLHRNFRHPLRGVSPTRGSVGLWYS